jgi:hypothetical protein
MEIQMSNMSELMRQARMFLAQNPHFIPLHHVEEVAYYGNVDVYVMARGVNVTTPEGNAILNWEAALYLVCRQQCDMGVGNRPYVPHPYMRDPILIEPEEEVVIADLEEGPQHQPDEPDVDPLDLGEPAVDPLNLGGDGVRVYGPFVGSIPDLPPMCHFPSEDFAQDLKEQPKPKPKQKVEHEEYTEPMDEENRHLFF